MEKTGQSGRVGESWWSPGTGKPYQNRIKTPSIDTAGLAD
jgi:hypothetical protein